MAETIDQEVPKLEPNLCAGYYAVFACFNNRSPVPDERAVCEIGRSLLATRDLGAIIQMPVTELNGLVDSALEEIFANA